MKNKLALTWIKALCTQRTMAGASRR